jgi:ATP-dependent RNA helicase DeaD
LKKPSIWRKLSKRKVGIGLSDFLSLGVTDKFVHILKTNGIVEPTAIQIKAIPAVLKGEDLIAQAQTGTGKTFAFILPILEKLESNSDFIQALIVTPTRELALQITSEVEKLVSDLEGIEVLAVYGGQDVDKQLKKLKRSVQIVVGTPGRLLDHIGRGTIDFSQVSFLVLDEADQMLHIGFLKEVEEIIAETPYEKQTLLFSATMPSEIRSLAKKHMRNPQQIQIEKKQRPADTVKQIAIHTIDRAKQATLISLIETHRPYLAVIFCRTKRRVSKLYEVLKSKGFSCDELHGDLSQAKREQVMKRFRDGEVQLLVATDVAARGLDVEGVTHVFNYDIPLDPESYIHRIGRTGRAGMKGFAITLYSSKDRPLLDKIENDLKIIITKKNNENNEQPKNQKRVASSHKVSSKTIQNREAKRGNDKTRTEKQSDRSYSRGKEGERNKNHKSVAGKRSKSVKTTSKAGYKKQNRRK